MDPIQPNHTPPTQAPSDFHAHVQFQQERSVEASARHLAGWSLGLGISGLATCGALSGVGVGFGIASLLKKRTAFGWTATSVSAACTILPITGCLWWMSFVSSQMQQAMLRFQDPAGQASLDLVQWHEALAAAKLNGEAPQAWTIDLITQRNPNLALPSLDPWGNAYLVEPAGPYEFRSIGPDYSPGTADDMVIDAEGIVRTIDAGDATTPEFAHSYSSSSKLTPATEAELSRLNEKETRERMNLVIDELKVSPQQAQLRHELGFLAKHRAQLARTSTVQSPEPEAHSLNGTSLYPPPLTPEREAQLLANLDAARKNAEQNPDSEDALIWVGRRLAYLGRYRESIAWYTKAINHLGSTPKLLRHRGHRYITVREFDKAIRDLTDARQLALDLDDEIEPDGIPTPAGPRSTLKGNIAYHLALAQFCKGDLDAARTAWQEALDLATNDDSRVAASYWLAITEFERGNPEAAQAVLKPMTPALDVQENQSYLKLTLLLKGDLVTIAEGQEVSALGAAVDQATFGFGIAMHARHVLKEETTARHLLESNLDCPEWAAFGMIASEVVSARIPQE